MSARLEILAREIKTEGYPEIAAQLKALAKIAEKLGMPKTYDTDNELPESNLPRVIGSPIIYRKSLTPELASHINSQFGRNALDSILLNDLESTFDRQSDSSSKHPQWKELIDRLNPTTRGTIRRNLRVMITGIAAFNYTDAHPDIHRVYAVDMGDDLKPYKDSTTIKDLRNIPYDEIDFITGGSESSFAFIKTCFDREGKSWFAENSTS